MAASAPEVTASPFWDEAAVSEIELRQLIGLTDESENANRANFPRVSHLDDVDCGSWQNAPNSKCHASFGDQGTTATVGIFGQLVQFSDHLDAGNSGMFCVDHLSVPEPYYVEARATKLHGLSQQAFHYGPAPPGGLVSMLSPSRYESLLGDIFPCGNPRYGLRFPDLVMKPDLQPNFKWIHWRWPCHEYPFGQFEDHPRLKLTVQWMIREKTVLQRCIFENDGEDDIEVNMDFCKYMVIRDLDHLNPHHQFNKDKRGDHDIRPGPGGYSWVCVHKFNTKQHDQALGTNNSVRGIPTKMISRHLKTDSFKKSPGWKDMAASSAPPPTEASRNDATGSITRQKQSQHQHQEAIQDNHPLFSEPDSTADSRTERTGKSQLSSHDRDACPEDSYGVSVISSVAIDGRVQQFEDSIAPQRWKLVVGGRRISRSLEPRALEVIAAYKMEHVQTSKARWQDYVIPWHNMRVSEFLREQQPGHSMRMCTPAPFEGFTPRVGQTREDLCDGGTKAPAVGSVPEHHHGDGIESTQRQDTPVDSPTGTPGKESASSSSGAPQNHLEFAARRNLEHILSVCAVQTAPQTHDTVASIVAPSFLHDVEAVALTCGDMSGHRICWSASFFAFRFLVESYKVLRRHPNEQDSEWSLLRRIKETCRGHLKWLYHVQKQNSGQRFGANYWITGKLMIKPGLSDSWVAENSLLDTGFQILKVAACMEIWDDKDIEFGFATDLMSEWAPSWLLLMENSDKRKKYAWPHTEKEGIKTFRLDEHVWIWRALKSLETMGDQALEKLPEKTRKSQPASRPDIDEQEDSGRSPALDWKVRLREIFPSDVVQRGISRRFTTENTVLRKRMLATTRSIRESRFMLHARDTAIVYEEPFDFLGKDNSAKELWKTTVRYQMYHTEYQESNWEKTLRHALNIMLGARDLSINNSPPKKMIREATDILFRSSSPNGFFPGRIETSTNKPVAASCILEGDMESYYHASFEIPYILLTHMDQVRDAYKWRELEVPKSRRHSDSRLGGNFSLKASTPHDIGLVQCDAGQRQVLLRLSDLLLSRSTVSDLDTREVFPDVRRTSKKAVPFDGLVDSNNIVKLDDEWLYKYPDFFSRGKKLEIDDSDQGLTELKAKLHPRERDTYSGQFALNDNIKRNLQYCIVDIGSSKRDEGKRTERDPTYFKKPQNLENAINLSRTAQNSKKRLLSFIMVPKQVALHCYTTAEASERLNLKDFFRRHARYAKYAFDHCSMIRNCWESEFHLSYYQLLESEESSNLPHGIAPPHSKPFPGGLAKNIVRASASFRFNGDFFDRHWTCYMLDSSPKGPIISLNLLEDRAYCQRKVLEQRYFADILISLTKSAEDILDEVYRCLSLERESGSFLTSIHTTNAYLSWSALWQDFEPLVQKLHADLASSQTVVSQWEAREEDRGKEKPRWTSNDERKYRASILTIRREIRHRISLLQHLHETTRSLQDLCSTRLDKAREDLGFRSEQNIAMFTYVTVVFLPLGFAASIFSMSGPPETRVAINMVLASIVALVVTIVALMNAKMLGSVAENVSKKFEDLTEKRKRSSMILQGRKQLGNKVETSKIGDLNTDLVRAPSTVTGSWNLLFWTGYIFVEVPARTILAACRAIGWSPEDYEDGEGSEDSNDAESARAAGKKPAGEEHSPSPSVTQATHPPGQPGGGGYEHNKMVARVVLGLFTIPVFLVTWIIQILCLNAWDTLVLLGGLLRRGLSHMFLSHHNEPDSKLLSSLARPPQYLRPLSMLKDHRWSGERSTPPLASTKSNGATQEVSFLEKASEASQ